MRSSSGLLSILLAMVVAANAADFSVNVGQSGLTYTPDHVSGAAVGDTVSFTFASTIHTVTQGTLATPCTKLSSGFDSGSGVSNFRVTVNDTQPIWIYCATPGHCSSGMVFAINAVSDAQLAQYRQNAVNPGSNPSTASASTSTTSSSGNSGGSNPYGGGYGNGSALHANASPAIVLALLSITLGILMM